MAVSLVDVARRLRELIAALDRRLPRAEPAAEAVIGRDAAVLRERAETRLAEIGADAAAAREDPSDHAG